MAILSSNFSEMEWEKHFMKFGSLWICYSSSENVTKSAESKIFIQQLEQSILVIIERCVSQICFVAQPLYFLWITIIGNGLNRACLIQPLDSKNTTMVKSKELNNDRTLDKLCKQFFVSTNFIARSCLPYWGRKPNYHLLLRENWSRWSRVNKLLKEMFAMNLKLLEERCWRP